MAAAGVEHERMASEEAEDRWPGMRFDETVLFHAAGGRCLADLAVRTLQSLAEARGATVHFGTGPARLASMGDGVEVVAGDTAWRAPVAVVTAGGWVGSVLAGSGVPLPPLRVTQEQVQHFARGEPGGSWPSFIHRREHLRYGLEAPGEGVKVGVHQAGLEVDPNDRPKWNDEFELSIVDYVERWLPGLETPPVSRTLCLYTNTATDDFVLDRAGPVVIGSPCSGHGFKFTPLIGRLLTDLAEGQPLPAELSPRFRLGR
jgi:sarcosine oxidase